MAPDIGPGLALDAQARPCDAAHVAIVDDSARDVAPDGDEDEGDDVDDADAIVPSTSTDLVPAGDDASQINPVASYLARLPSPNSRTTVRDALKRCVRLTGYGELEPEQVPWERVEPAHADAIRSRLLEKYAPNTARLGAAALRGVIEQCFVLGLVDADRLERVRLVLKRKIRGRREEPAGRALADEEVLRLRKSCDRMGEFRGAMMGALLALALGCGLRREELAKLDVDSLSADCRRVTFVGKGGVEATLPLPTWGAAALETWLAQRDRFPFEHEGMFVYLASGRADARRRPSKKVIARYVSEIGSAAKIEDFSPHDLRRTFITRMVEAQGLATGSKAARHADPRTTMRYDRRPFEELAKAVEKATAGWETR